MCGADVQKNSEFFGKMQICVFFREQEREHGTDRPTFWCVPSGMKPLEPVRFLGTQPVLITSCLHFITGRNQGVFVILSIHETSARVDSAGKSIYWVGCEGWDSMRHGQPEDGGKKNIHGRGLKRGKDSSRTDHHPGPIRPITKSRTSLREVVAQNPVTISHAPPDNFPGGGGQLPGGIQYHRTLGSFGSCFRFGGRTPH